MEDLAVYQRLNEINRQKAAMGLGFDGGCADSYLQPDYIGGYEGYGDGVLVGGGGRKLSNYNRFVCAFAKKHKGKYRSGATMLKAAATAWRKCSKSGKCGARYSAKRAPYGCKRRGARGKTAKRKRGSGYDDMFGGDMFDMGGILIGGAKKRGKKKATRRKPKLPTAAQLRNLGMTPYEFELMRLQTKQNPYGNLIPKYPSAKLARIGKRFSRRRNPNNNVCAYPNMNGPYLLDRNYDCVQYVPGALPGTMKGLEQLAAVRALENIAPPAVSEAQKRGNLFGLPKKKTSPSIYYPYLALPASPRRS